MAKKKQPERTTRSKPEEKCFNCGKKGHYTQDCRSSTLNKRKPEASTEEAKHSRWKRNQAKAARSNEQDDSDPEPYPAGWAFITRKVDEDQSEEWYLDSCASRHISNNRERFADLRPKSYKFVTARGTIIRSSQVGTIILPIENGLQLTLSNVAFTPECDSNLISLGQLRETFISYHDYPEKMVLKQGGEIIGSATRKRNLFVLDTLLPLKTMLVQDRGQPTYLLSSNLQIQLWHRRLGHASNARVVQVSKLVDGIDLGEITTEPIDKPQSSDSEPESDSDVDKPFPINKTMELNIDDVEELCKACIESKHTRIVK